MSHMPGSQVIDDSDEECLQDLKAVLERHGKLSKFGVALLHKHFDLEDNELMVESNDPLSRTLTTRAVSSSVAEVQNLVPTLWRFDGPSGYKCTWCNKNHC